MTKAEKICYAGLVVLYALLTCIYFVMGPIPNIGFGRDVVYMLDWASRIDQGQIPHNDFQSFIGPGFLYVCWFFLKIAHLNVFGFSLANICVAGVAFGSAMSLVLLSQRFSSTRPLLLPATLVLLTILSCAYGTYVLAFDGAVSYANIYNRWGYALLAVVFLQAIVIKEHSIPAALVSGSIIGALFLIKPTYAYVGIGLVILGILLGYERRPMRVVLSLCSALVVVACFLAISGIDASMMLHDYSVPMQNRISFLMLHPGLVADKLFASSYGVIVLAAMAVLLVLHFRKGDVKEILSFAALLAMMFLLQLTNFGFLDSPMALLVLVFSILSLNLFQKFPELTCALIVLICGCFYAKNFASFAEAGVLAFNKNHYQEMNLGPYKGMRVISLQKNEAQSYDNKISEGVELIRAHVEKPEKIAALSFENPFNIAFQTTAPRFLPTVWDYGMSYTSSNAPDFAGLFKDSRYVMVETIPDSNGEMLFQIYQNDIRRDFRQVATSPSWSLWQRM